ncbi:hypothetical protein H4582DRAFT_2083733 [Lactarius indigo]|nr:hypothetical protein H4582DRAFT_2083733 [Lactarius indigo]
MSVFLILVNYLAALFATQLLRSDLQSSEAMNFGQIFTYSAMAEIPLGQSWVVVTFIVFCYSAFPHIILEAL